MFKLRNSKFLLLLLVVTVILSGFTGCKSKETSKTESKELSSTEVTEQKEEANEGTSFQGQTLEVYAFEGGYGKAYWEEIAKKFEADYPGVTVELTTSPKIIDLIKPRMVAGTPPDFFYVNGVLEASVDAMIKDKVFMELNDVFDGNALDQEVPLKEVVTDGFLDYCQPYKDGKIYYAPAYVGVSGLWYNKTLFKQMGWVPPTTWDEFLAFGDIAEKEGKHLFTYQGIYPGYLVNSILSTIASEDGIGAVDKIFNYEEGSWSTETVKSILGVYQEISDQEYLLPGTVAMNHTQAQTEFLQGKALFCPNGSWFEGEMKEAIPDEGFSFGFIPIPALTKGEQQYMESFFETFLIPKQAKNPELAKEFLRYQYKEENVILNAETSQGVMAVKDAPEKVKPYIADSIYNCFKQFDNGVKPIVWQFKPTDKKVEINIFDEISQPISSIMNKEIGVDEWVERLEKANKIFRDAMTQ